MPLHVAETEKEIEDCYWQPIEPREKPERNLLLRIVDAQNPIAEERYMDSSICGFHLTLEMANELNYYEKNRHPLSAKWAKADAYFDLLQ